MSDGKNDTTTMAPPTEPTQAFGRFWDALSTRRVLPAGLVYCGAAWGCLEAGQFFIGYFGLGPDALRTLVLTALFGLPITLILAWYHGAPGSQYVTTREILLVGSLLFVWFVLVVLPPEPAAPRPAHGPPPSHGTTLSITTTAVLYFQNLTADPAMHWVAAGLCDATTTGLSTVPGLTVLARSRVTPYRGPRPPDLTAVAADLGCGRLVAGSYQAAGGRLRVTCLVVDGATGTTLTAWNLDGTLDDIFALQDDLVTRLRTFFADPTTTAAPPPAPSPSIAAYRAYCHALAAMDAGHLEQAATALRDAVEGGLVYAPSLDDLLRLQVSTTYLGADDSIVQEELWRIRHDGTGDDGPDSPQRSYWLRGIFTIQSARSMTGAELEVVLHGRDDGGNNSYELRLSPPLAPGATTFLRLRRRDHQLVSRTGTCRRMYTPDSICYNGPPRRVVETFVLPDGAEPFLLRPPPSHLFMQDGLWQVTWARRLGSDVSFAPDLFYGDDRALAAGCDGMQSFDPTVLYAAPMLVTSGAAVVNVTYPDDDVRPGDVVVAVDGTAIGSAGELLSWRREPGTTGPVAYDILQGGTRRRVLRDPDTFDMSIEDAPACPVGAAPLGDVLLTRARVAAAAGDDGRCTAILTRLLTLPVAAEQRVATMVLLADRLAARGEAAEAEGYRRRAVAALVAAGDGVLVEAPTATWQAPVAELTERLRRDPTDFLAAYGLARHHLDGGAPADARRAVDRALAAEPAMGFTHALAARVLLAQGDTTGAATQAALAVEGDRDNERAILAQYLFERADRWYEAAVTVLERHLRTYPRVVRNPYYVALGVIVDRDDEGAFVRLYDVQGPKLRDLPRRLNDICYMLARGGTLAYGLTGDGDGRGTSRALTLARWNARRRPDDLDLADTLGEMLFLNGRWTECRQVFGAIAARSSGPWPRVDLFVGRCLVHEGRVEEGRAALAGAAATTGPTAEAARQELRERHIPQAPQRPAGNHPPSRPPSR